MGKTNLTAVDADSIAVNGVPVTGSPPLGPLATMFDVLEIANAAAINGSIIQGSLPVGTQFTRFTHLNAAVITVNGVPLTGGGGGGGTSPNFTNFRTNTIGSRILMDITSGVWNGGTGILVDPSKVFVTATVASVDASGNANTATIIRSAGLRAEFFAGAPNRVELWLEDIVYADHSTVVVSMAAGALTCGAQTNGPTTGGVSVTNNNVLISTPLPVGHIIGAVESRTVNKVQHAVMRATWRPEAAGIHESTLAGVEWTIVKTGGGTTVLWQGEERRSWYQDTYQLSNAQWTANGGSGEAGLGVWPGPVSNPLTDPTGPVTITALFVPRAGGRARARSRTWTVYSARAGAYPKKEVWLDTVGGSDANSGLTPLLPKLTMIAACNTAGAAAQGATAQTEPVVYIVGGTSGSPRDVEFLPPIAGAISNVPGQTDTYLTLMPAPGFAKDTIRLVQWAVAGGGPTNRIRRTRFQDLIIDSCNSAVGNSSNAISAGQTSLYPPATDPQAFWFDGCSLTHRQGKAGQLFELTSGNFIVNLFRENPAYWTNWDHYNTNQRGIQSSTATFLRNFSIVNFGKDALKSVDHAFGFYVEDNAVDPIQLPVSALSNTGPYPTPGDTITGVFSWPASETVSSFALKPPSSLVEGTVLLTPGGDSYAFKADDSKLHTAITITGETGTIGVGNVVRNAGSTVRFRVFRRDGNILRGAFILGTSFGNVLITDETNGATATITATANDQKSLFFSPSGALGTAQPPHPDGMQLQAFVPKILVVTPISGAFQVGEVLTVPNVNPTITVTAISGNQISVTAANSLFEVRSSNTVTGVTSGATATIDMVLADTTAGADRNVVVANGVMRRIDGQILFGENGSYGCGVWNVIGVRNDSAGSANSHFDDISAAVIAHCTLPNQDYVMALPGGVIRPGQPQSQSISYNIFASNSAVYVATPPGGGDDMGQPGRRNINHSTTPVGSLAFGSRLPDAYNSNSNPAFVNGVAWNEDDSAANLAKNNYRPTGSVPANTAVPITKRFARYDIRGVERVNGDWPGAVSLTP